MAPAAGLVTRTLSSAQDPRVHNLLQNLRRGHVSSVPEPFLTLACQDRIPHSRIHRWEFISYHTVYSIFKYRILPSVIHTWTQKRRLHKAPGCGRLERSPAPTSACEIPGQIPGLVSRPSREGRLRNVHLLTCSRRKTVWSPAQCFYIMVSAWTVGLRPETLCKPSCTFNHFSCAVSHLIQTYYL